MPSHILVPLVSLLLSFLLSFFPSLFFLLRPDPIHSLVHTSLEIVLPTLGIDTPAYSPFLHSSFSLCILLRPCFLFFKVLCFFFHPCIIHSLHPKIDPFVKDILFFFPELDPIVPWVLYITSQRTLQRPFRLPSTTHSSIATKVLFSSMLRCLSCSSTPIPALLRFDFLALLCLALHCLVLPPAYLSL